MDKLDRHRALADGRGDAFDRPGAHVADSKQTGQARLQEVWSPGAVGAGVLVLDVDAGDQEPVLVHRDVTTEPLGVRGGAAGVGKATTAAVVTSIILIFITNFLLSLLFFGSTGTK